MCQENDDDDNDDVVAAAGAADVDEDDDEPIIYENIETIKRNGNCKHLTITPIANNNRECTEQFLKIERENHYEIIDDDKTDELNDGDHLVTTDLDVPDKCQNDLLQEEDGTQNIYENLRTDPIVIPPDGALETCTEELSITSDITDNVNVVTINEPTETKNDTKFELNLETVDAVVNNETTKSAKSRMFLSTDDTSCLLFTQTVTSPMLTPSEENIDFLKGFKCQSNQNTLSDNTSQKSDEEELPIDEFNKLNNGADYENIYENDDDGDNIYENLDEVKENKVVNLVVSHYDVPQSLRSTSVEVPNEPQEEIYEIIEEDVEKVKDLSDNNTVVDRLKKDDDEEAPQVLKDDEEDDFKEPEVIACTAKTNGDTINGDVIYESIQYEDVTIDKTDEEEEIILETLNEKTKFSNVELLKCQFQCENTTAITCQNVCDTINECKNYDIAKRINKFENISPNNEEVDATTNNCAQLVSVILLYLSLPT